MDEEASKVKGGTIYADYDGNIIGRVGAGNNLRFTDKSIEELRISYSENEGTAFTSPNLNEDVKTSFINKFSKNKGLRLYNNPTGYPNWMAQIDLDSGVLSFSNNSRHWDNFYNITSVLKHENYHYDQHLGTKYSKKDLCMVEAHTIAYQMQQSDFSNTTDELKNMFKQNLIENLRQAGYNNAAIRSFLEDNHLTGIFSSSD